MKILHIGKYSPPFFGGIENFMMDLTESCQQQGATVAAIVHHHQSGQRFDQRDINGVTIYRVPCYGKLMFAPLSPAFGLYLNKVISEFQPDILHIHMPNTAAFFALFSSSARKLPWVVHWHSDVLGDNSPWFLKTFYPFYRPFESAVLKRAASIIATSPPYLATSKTLQRFAAKCQVISLAIKPPNKTSVMAKTVDEKSPLQLLIVGRMTFYKGHRYLIEALSLLKSQGLTKIHLNIVGGGELESQLSDQIKHADLDAQVKLLGKLSYGQLQQQFQQADCLCLPSIERTEAFGVVLMEAAAHAVPAIVSDVPGSGMSWAVQGGKTGLVVKRSNSQALAEAIEQLYHQREFCQQLGQAALMRFEQHFDIEHVAKTTIELYKSVNN